MRAFSCPVCRHPVFFENTACLSCGSPIGWSDAARDIVAVMADGGPWRCENHEAAECSWLVAEPGTLCASCRLTRTRPADGDATGMEEWVVAEAAKRRLLYTLAHLGLPVVSWADEPGGLAFDLLSSEREPVTTGHADGTITLDLAEADAAHREAMREQLAEPYRTMLGHFRHEVGHWYWDRVVPEGPLREEFRARFGDERASYADALERHYAHGAPADWGEAFVSSYATMHPWEDWAETWAHHLHITDTMETAQAFGLVRRDPTFAAGLDDWMALSVGLNAVNRSMGKDDLYPFVLTEPVREKLAFVDRAIAAAAAAAQPASAPA